MQNSNFKKLLFIIPILLIISGLFLLTMQSGNNSSEQNQLNTDSNQLITTTNQVVANTQPILITNEEVLNHDGQLVQIEGVLGYSFNSGKQTIISFAQHHKGFVKALIKEQNYDQFDSNPQEMYPVGTKVRITGVLDWYQGDQTIYVTSPSQIEKL